MALQKAVGANVEPRALAVMRAEQSTFDEKQGQVVQHAHAMTGVREKGFNGESRPQAIARANAFVKSRLAAAMTTLADAANEKDGNAADALKDQAARELSQGLHTLQDGTSPAHEGFQSLANAKEDPIGWAGHLATEDFYPKGDRAKLLEGATRWGLDVFTGAAPMPENFFNPTTGKLAIPAEYLQ